MKTVDYKILFELMKNAKRSDREIAKVLGVSQPTVTRKRSRLEKEVIEEYVAIPKWEKIGYNLLAIILVKSPSRFALGEKVKEATERSVRWLDKQPNVVMAGRCRGMGMSGFMITLHKSFTDYDNFMNEHRRQLGDLLEDVQSILVNLSGEGLFRALSLKYLAEASLTEQKEP